MDIIKFMDLSRQTALLKPEILENIGKVIDKNAFVGGEFVKQFEEEFANYIGTDYSAGVSNGTDALFLACKALGIGSGDEVILPSNTFISTAWAPLRCGAKVVFADCNRENWLLDIEKIEQYITDNTKAIIAVHMYGQPLDIISLKKLCERRRLFLIEDCAQAHGAKWGDKTVGSIGDIGCFSFYPGKNLGAYGDAGAITTSSEKLYKKIIQLRDHGAITRYHHDISGYNMRLDGIQAAILSVKLKYLPEWTKRRIEIANEYDIRISNSNIQKCSFSRNAHSVYHLYVVLVDDRHKFLDYMEKNGIICGIHYPIPCHKQQVFLDMGYNDSLPITEYVSDHCVSLPMFPELKDEEIDRVITIVNNY